MEWQSNGAMEKWSVVILVSELNVNNWRHEAFDAIVKRFLSFIVRSH